jgi:hypothetical protein
VGDGFGSLRVYATAVYVGFDPRASPSTARARAPSGPTWPLIPPENEPTPLVPPLAAAAGTGAPALAREFSAVRELPPELRDLPSPSGVHRRPEGAARRS